MAATKEQYNFAASIQEELTQIAHIDSILEQSKGLDWQTMSSDEMIRAKIELDRYKESKEALVKGLSMKQNDYQQAQQQSTQELLDKGTEVLKGKIQGWGKEKQKEMNDYALADGFT